MWEEESDEEISTYGLQLQAQMHKKLEETKLVTNKVLLDRAKNKQPMQSTTTSCWLADAIVSTCRQKAPDWCVPLERRQTMSERQHKTEHNWIADNGPEDSPTCPMLSEASVFMGISIPID